LSEINLQANKGQFTNAASYNALFTTSAFEHTPSWRIWSAWLHSADDIGV